MKSTSLFQLSCLLWPIAIQFVSDSATGYNGAEIKPELRLFFAQSIDISCPLKEYCCSIIDQ